MSDDREESNQEETLIRQSPNDDKTRIRSGKDNEHSSAGTPEQSLEPESVEPLILDAKETEVKESVEKSTAATILRGPKGEKPAATILSEPGQNTSSQRKASATILAEHATILGSGGSDADATIIAGDDDSTIINSMGDDDSTIIGGGIPGKMDTTYIANVGDLGKSKGNTEAGRLLKNRFVLEERIGSGGMGDVYKALDLRQQEAKERNPYIAIKILNETFARHKDAFISLQREATRTRGIPHPNIMGVYDFDREGDTVFMSMELLDGQPLDDYLKDHPEGVSIEDAWNIIDGISQGLARAHGAGIVHSDFKPGNIYYTADKLAKVFDFGIARAVPTKDGEELEESVGDATVFDAGSLGALTPTYASLEMLTGQVPAKSDDVYAVALVAYELFTGKHPYNRVPANKALDQGLEPAPIPFLKRRHWKALKKALALKGEDRTQTIEEFQEGMFSEDLPVLRYAAITIVLLASVSFGLYQQFKVPEVLPDGFTEKLQAFNANEAGIQDNLLARNRIFASVQWRDGLDRQLERMKLANITVHDPEWVSYVEESWVAEPQVKINQAQMKIVEGYLGEINTIKERVAVELGSQTDITQVDESIAMLGNAQEYLGLLKQKYYFDLGQKEAEVDPLLRAQYIKKEDLNKKMDQESTSLSNRLAAKNGFKLVIEAEVRRLADEAQARRDAKEVQDFVNEKAKGFQQEYLGYLTKFKSILLNCKPKFNYIDEENLTRLGEVIAGLKSTHPRQYALDKPGIVAALAGCIGDRIAFAKPARARQVKKVVMTYLPGEPDISGILIKDKDACDKGGLVGQGDRNRNWCVDKLVVAKIDGPQLVVIPSKLGEFSKYAISRMEIKVGEFNRYCESIGCEQKLGEISNPVTNVSISEIEGYLGWLTSETGKTYRLPTSQEWEYAARANSSQVYTNINCTVDSRGVRLGDKLLNTLTGKPNEWGLYNYVGNARELAIVERDDEPDELVALGGAHTDPRSQCTIEKRVAHQGNADSVTGFRVVRVIPKKG